MAQAQRQSEDDIVAIRAIDRRTLRRIVEEESAKIATSRLNEAIIDLCIACEKLDLVSPVSAPGLGRIASGEKAKLTAVIDRLRNAIAESKNWDEFV